MLKYGKLLLCFSIITLIMLTGCFKGEQSLKTIDEPQDAEQVDKLDDVVNDHEDELEGDDQNEAGERKTVTRELYLIDVNGMVVAQEFELPLPESKEVAIQVLEHLVKGGPITNHLPNGFQAVLPEGTEVLSLNLQEDGTLVVDLSEDFVNYEAEEEVKILEAITFTLTQFDSVDRIKLMINGNLQTEMPVDGTPIGEGYSRANGINFIQTNTIDFIASKPVTMFYPSEYNGNRYYVPVTQHVEVKDGDLYSAIVTALVDGPRYDINVTHVFNAHTLLTESPTLTDGVLELMFSEEILKDIDKAMISDEVMETLVRTLTEQQAVEAIQVKVENNEQIINENGEMYTEPVTNQSFNLTEKM